jgi:hypothetical protein
MPVDGNLIVPPGATCSLIGVTVTGNVRVQTNAVLLFQYFGELTTIEGDLRAEAGASLSGTGIEVLGNVGADNCGGPNLEEIHVGGNYYIRNCTGGNVVVVVRTQIGGNFDCSNNSVPCEFDDNTVKGNVQINKNGGTSTARLNTIGGNLRCEGNTSIIDTDDMGDVVPNTVGGQRQGQCAGF